MARWCSAYVCSELAGYILCTVKEANRQGNILCGAWVAWVGRRGEKSDLYKCVTCRINSGSG